MPAVAIQATEIPPIQPLIRGFPALSSSEALLRTEAMCVRSNRDGLHSEWVGGMLRESRTSPDELVGLRQAVL